MARGFTLMAPFNSFSGKLQKQSYKLVVDGVRQTNHKYFTGIYRKVTENQSFTFNPSSTAFNGDPTDLQLQVRNNFKTAQTNTTAVLTDATQKALAVARFKKQTRYKYLRTFVFAEEMAKLRS